MTAAHLGLQVEKYNDQKKYNELVDSTINFVNEIIPKLNEVDQVVLKLVFKNSPKHFKKTKKKNFKKGKEN